MTTFFKNKKIKKSGLSFFTTDEDDISTNNPLKPIAYGGLSDQNDMIVNYE